MESIIGINKDKYIFKGKEYNIFNIRDLLSKLNKNRRIIIFNENIFIKKYKIGEKDLEKFINEKIKEDFTNRNELLFHYDYRHKDQEVFLYSIKNVVSKELYRNARSLEIKPVQFWVKNYLRKKNKIKDFLAIFKLNSIYYLVDVEEDIIIKSYLSSNLDELKEKLYDDSSKNKVIIKDSSLSELKLIKDFKEGKAGKILYEKIYKK